ncbi:MULTISPECIES: hypothetical protein [Stenotrophomonas]|uniref:hypothetical protein n=1 Tax=Stenotrophomonas TaxID=40323 RepID=UPI0021C9EB9F|nr:MULTISPECIES: hypothetical protein [Stenotrophomonas]MCX2920463.1 hypothetical protein [Stenotrophomonas rhizophila]
MHSWHFCLQLFFILDFWLSRRRRKALDRLIRSTENIEGDFFVPLGESRKGLDPALHAPLSYYRDNGVIRDAGADRLYLDLDVLVGLKAKTKRTGRNVPITVMVLAVLVAAVVVVLATW